MARKPSRKAKLTTSRVRELVPGQTAYVVWDEQLPRFGLQVFPSGTKTFVVNYRTTAGDQRRITLGRWTKGGYGADAARAAALAKLAAIQAGADPRAEAKAKRLEVTVSYVLDRYLAEHICRRNKPRTRRRVEQLVGMRIRPAFGSLRLSALVPSTIRHWHNGLAATPVEANRALAALRKALSLATDDWDLLSSNPAKGIKLFPERQLTRVLTSDELARLRQVLAEVEATGTVKPSVILTIRLLALTGLRTAEVLALRWQDVDLDGRSLTLVDSKTGTRVAPLGRHASGLLSKVSTKDRFVISGRSPGTALSEHTLRGAWRRIRKRAEISGDAGLHVFRRTAATMAAMGKATVFELRDGFGWKGLAMPNRYVARANGAGVPDLFGEHIGASLGLTP
jgi:integrase